METGYSSYCHREGVARGDPLGVEKRTALPNSSFEARLLAASLLLVASGNDGAVGQGTLTKYCRRELAHTTLVIARVQPVAKHSEE